MFSYEIKKKETTDETDGKGYIGAMTARLRSGGKI